MTTIDPAGTACWVCGQAFTRLTQARQTLYGFHNMRQCLSRQTDTSGVSALFLHFDAAWRALQEEYRVWRLGWHGPRRSLVGNWHLRYCHGVWLVEFVQTVPRGADADEAPEGRARHPVTHERTDR
jgi:hypothetical protein